MQPPLFPSDCEFAQLLTIFQVLGTPTEETWPGVTELKDWCAVVISREKERLLLRCGSAELKDWHALSCGGCRQPCGAPGMRQGISNPDQRPVFPALPETRCAVTPCFAMAARTPRGDDPHERALLHDSKAELHAGAGAPTV